MFNEGRLLRQSWTSVNGDGVTKACLLAALAPACGELRTALACPATVMPAWFAHITPNLDDCGSAKAWPDMVRQYADLAGRWHVLTDADWEAASLGTLQATLRFVNGAHPIVRRIIRLMERGHDITALSEWDRLQTNGILDWHTRDVATLIVHYMRDWFRSTTFQRADQLATAIRAAMNSPMPYPRSPQSHAEAEIRVDGLIFAILDVLTARIVLREAALAAAVMRPQLVDA